MTLDPFFLLPTMVASPKGLTAKTLKLKPYTLSRILQRHLAVLVDFSNESKSSGGLDHAVCTCVYKAGFAGKAHTTSF